MRIVVYDQKSKGKPTAKHVSSINSWTATWRHRAKRLTGHSYQFNISLQSASVRSTSIPKRALEENTDDKDDTEAPVISFACQTASLKTASQHCDIPSHLFPHGTFPCALTHREYGLLHYFMNVSPAFLNVALC